MKRQKRISIMLAFSLMLSGIWQPTGKAEQVQTAESIEEDFELFEGASGYIDVDFSMPDLYFTPEEDGAFLLMVMAECMEAPSVVTEFNVCELKDGKWERIDTFSGPATGSSEGKEYLWRRIPQFYQKGKRYRIQFNPVAYVGSEACRYYFTFTKTELAGCTDGMFWRLSELADSDLNILESEQMMITRYEGDAKILEIPSSIGGYPVYSVNYDDFWENNMLQVIIIDEKVQFLHNFFGGNTSIKDIYIYNKDCKFLTTSRCEEWDDWTVYSYSGGEVEKLCEENDWRFISLGDYPSTQPPAENTPDISNMPTPTVVPTPSPATTEKPSATPDTTELATMEPTTTPEITEPITERPPSMPDTTELVTMEPTTTPEITEPITEQPPSTPDETKMVTAEPTGTPDIQALGSDDMTESTSDGEQGSKAGREELAAGVIEDFWLEADYTSVSLSWGSISGLSAYWIYRSQKKNTGYQLIKKVKDKNAYKDKKVVPGKKYYYWIKAVERSGGVVTVRGQSKVKKIQLRLFSRPIVQIRKGRTGEKRYLIIRVKKYQGNKLEIFYKGKGKYRKLIVRSADIKKQKGCFRIRYLSSNRNLYFKMRTYSKINNRKVYSRFTKKLKVKV